MKGAVRYEKMAAVDGACVAVLTMDNPPVNALSAGVRNGLSERMKEAIADPTVVAIVVTGAHAAYSGGFDITEFAKGVHGVTLPSVIDQIEASTKPVIAAIDGVSLGGGLEVALGCHFRLASTRTRVGLPEVNLGILPGAGGTQRLPRIVGAETAIDVMCTGAPLPAARAAQAGIVEKVVEGDNAVVVKAAVDFASEKAGSDLAPWRVSTRSAQGAPNEVFAAKRKQYATMRRGENAPQAIITCVEAALDCDYAEGRKVEAEQFMKLAVGSQARALQYMFFAERQCSKILGLNEKSGPLDTVGIVGVGLMGGGIAMCCAEAGMKVFLLDFDQKNLERGMAVVKKNYHSSVTKKRRTQEQVDKILSRFTPTTDYRAFGQCDIVVEAVFESMQLKKNIFTELDRVCKLGCVLATNTSRLDIDMIASATKRPQDVVGTHFFSPANVMPLLENVRGPRTSPKTLATAMEFGKKLKKVTCLVGNCDGFIANRLMGMSGSWQLMHQGLMPHQIDAAAEAYGMRMGPCRMLDLVGLDLFGRERVSAGVANPDTIVTDALYAAKRMGQKVGKGFYKYDEKRRHSRDPEAEGMVEACWRKLGVSPTELSAEDIVDKLYLPVVNEGFRCLEEGMAARASDVDVCVVHGYGWPRFTGGPMRWADSVGLPKVLAKLQAMGVEPSNLLKECVDKKWRVSSKECRARVHQAWTNRWSQAKL